MRLHCPLRHLEFAHVRGEGLHDPAVRHSRDEIPERFLIAPHRKGPELSRKRPCLQRIANQPRRSPKLALYFKRETKEFWNCTVMFEWQIGNQSQITSSRNRSLSRFPGNDWHTTILIRPAAKTQNSLDWLVGIGAEIIFVARNRLGMDRSSEDDRRNKFPWNGRRKRKVVWRTGRPGLRTARALSA